MSLLGAALHWAVEAVRDIAARALTGAGRPPSALGPLPTPGADGVARFYLCRSCDVYARANPVIATCWVCGGTELEWGRYSDSCRPTVKPAGTLLSIGRYDNDG